MNEPTKACSNCAYCGKFTEFDRLKGQDLARNVCRRNPPQAVMANMNMVTAAWPTVKPDDWCGQWENNVVAAEPAVETRKVVRRTERTKPADAAPTKV